MLRDEYSVSNRIKPTYKGMYVYIYPNMYTLCSHNCPPCFDLENTVYVKTVKEKKKKKVRRCGLDILFGFIIP